MVEQTTLNDIFKSLADPTRRDILVRVYERQQTISELAEKYDQSFAGIAKHIHVLEKARLVVKQKSGKEQIVTIRGDSLKVANEYLHTYASLWSDRFDRLEALLREENK